MTSLAQFGVLVILQILLTPIVLTMAGQEVLGAYTIVMQIIGYGLILDFGIGVAIGRYLAQSFGKSDIDKQFAKIFNVGRYFLFITNALVAIFILLTAHNLESIITGSDAIIIEARTGLNILSIWAVARTPLALYGHGLLASQNMTAVNVIGMISSVCRLSLSLILVLTGLGLIGLIGANILAELTGMLLQRAYFRKLNSRINLKWCRPEIPLLKTIFLFGIKYWGVNIAAILTVGSDSIIVGNLYGAIAAGIFYTTKMPSFLITQLIYKISDNAAPASNELIARGDLRALSNAYLKIVRYSMLLALPVTIAIVGFNRGVITAWVGAGQYAGAVMTTALAVYVLTQVMNHINAMITLAVGNMRHWMNISIFMGSLTIVLAYTLGKLFDYQWVMVSIAVMDVPVCIFLALRSITGLCLQWRRVMHEAILPPMLVTLPLCGWVGFVIATNQVVGVFDLIFCITIYAIIWTISSYVLGLDRSEKTLLKQRLKTICY